MRGVATVHIRSRSLRAYGWRTLLLFLVETFLSDASTRYIKQQHLWSVFGLGDQLSGGIKSVSASVQYNNRREKENLKFRGDQNDTTRE